MKSPWFRYAVIATFACILGALAHASISAAMQSRDAGLPENPTPTTGTAPGNEEFPGLEARLTSLKAGDQSSKTKNLENTLLQKLWDVIDAAEDLSSNEKSEARAILEEADPVLARIKKDNQRAIQILRNPPRRVAPKRPAPAAKSEKPQPASDSAAEEEAAKK